MRRYKDKNFLLPIVQPFLHENKNPRQLSSATIPKCCLKKKNKIHDFLNIKNNKTKKKKKIHDKSKQIINHLLTHVLHNREKIL